MQPAAGESEATLTNNLLRSTAGNNTEVSPTENAFIIGKADNLVAFYPLSGTNRLIQMNKAYIVLPTSASSVKMNFDFNTTAIERVETLQPTAGAIYDISGRRVVKTVKGGLYISNGKKFVAQ
ncbi:MAG: hypothetical protein IKB97_10010, partial [Bacteroidaceae bacterium]|nr:hypothetical protein [Bacteroidaceae bacterium]